MGIREESKKVTRIKIINAAKKLFFENGFVKVSTKDISALSGVAQGSIFLHFQTKDNLLHELISSEISNIIEEVENIDFKQNRDQFVTSLLDVIERHEHMLSRLYKDTSYISDIIAKDIEKLEVLLKNRIFDHIRNEPKSTISIVDSFIRIDAFIAMIKVNLIDKKVFNEYSSILKQKRGKLVKLYRTLFDN